MSLRLVRVDGHSLSDGERDALCTAVAFLLFHLSDPDKTLSAAGLAYKRHLERVADTLFGGSVKLDVDLLDASLRRLEDRTGWRGFLRGLLGEP